MNIVELTFSDWKTLNISINWLAMAILILLVFAIVWIIKKVAPIIGRQSVVIDEASLGIGNSSVTLKFDRQDQEIAYKLWVELSTRKIALPFDDENDVVVEVYNSWYQFFGTARDLLKEIPASRLSYSGELVEVTQKVLNDGLRPHLTRWQAKYRKWYEKAANDNKDKTPQEIQRLYPEYAELISDLKATNERMISYRDCMHDIAFRK